MLEEFYTNIESDPETPGSVQSWKTPYHVLQFRFVPDSYFTVVGSELDPRVDLLLYLRTFVEEETEEAFV